MSWLDPPYVPFFGTKADERRPLDVVNKVGSVGCGSLFIKLHHADATEPGCLQTQRDASCPGEEIQLREHQLAAGLIDGRSFCTKSLDPGEKLCTVSLLAATDRIFFTLVTASAAVYTTLSSPSCRGIFRAF